MGNIDCKGEQFHYKASTLNSDGIFLITYRILSLIIISFILLQQICDVTVDNTSLSFLDALKSSEFSDMTIIAKNGQHVSIRGFSLVKLFFYKSDFITQAWILPRF